MSLKVEFHRRLGYFLVLVMMSSLFWNTGLSQNIKCGKPGVSSLCSTVQKREEYFVGENISYYYKYNNTYTNDNIIRTCLQDGSWSGRMPICYSKIDTKKFHENYVKLVEPILSNINMITDSNKGTCINISIDVPLILKIYLKESLFINEIEVIGYSESRVTVSAKVRNENKYQECRRYHNLNGSSYHFSCPKDMLSEEIKFELRTNNPVARRLQLCEVITYAEIVPSCVTPDIPYRGTGHSSRGNYATYTINCPTNYKLEGERILQCQSDGTWSPRSPTCKLIGCGPLPHVPGGTLIANSTLINSTVRLECEEGYIPLDDVIAHCLPTGSWTSTSFRCSPIQCDENPRIPHGKGILLDGSSYYGSKLLIQCDRGYIPIDLEFRECQEDATWENIDICREINCGPLRIEESLNNGEWKPLNETSSIRVLVCDPGYHIEGSPAVSLCLSNESWSYSSAVCKKTNEAWISDLSPNAVLMIAVAAGAGTAIFVLCLAMCGLLVKKRRHSATNTAVFHVGTTDCSLYNNGKEQFFFKTNTYEDVIELKSNPTNSQIRMERSALPHIPVDTDPVYAQPYESSSSVPTKTVPTNTAGDIYTAHIYAEPVDSQRPPSDPMCNSVTETWLRNGTRKFGRKMSLPGQSNTSDLVAQSSQNRGKVCKPMRYSTDMGSRNSTERNMFKPKREDSFTELITNAIYLDTKDRSFTSGDDVAQLQMIDNDIYQDDYFSHA